MNDLFDDTIEEIFRCRTYSNGHKYIYDAHKSSKECSVFSCICGEILDENEDSNAGC